MIYCNKNLYPIKILSVKQLITAGFDPLCDEGEAYALKLHNAGFYLKQLHYPSLFHGFISISLLRTARRAMEDMIDTLKKEL